ncbi:MAG: serine hydrolase, partial [Lysobacter sp.]|nr:serine hydrolase [Lysobacter sp.]
MRPSILPIPSRRSTLLVALLWVTVLAPAFAVDYVPPPQQWERRAPVQAGFDAGRLADAVAYAKENAQVEPSDLRVVLNQSFGKREPGYRILGPVVPRAQASGIIVRGGYIVAEWGDVERPDMTFSTVKSYLSTVAGLALGDGDLPALDQRVARSVPGAMFEGPHNSAITWMHLLHQTSDWSGTLWEVADWADRPEG